jgi:outer membrane protein assembly factor BamB
MRAAAMALALCLGGAMAAQEPSAAASASPAPQISANAPVHFRWASGGVLIARPVSGDGICYFLSRDRAAYALNDSGQVLFRADLDLSPQAVFTPVQAGFLYIADGNRVIRLNRSGGVSLSFEGEASSAKALLPPAEGFDGRVFAASASLSCYSATGGKKWSRALSSPAAIAPVVLGDGSLALGLEDGTVLGFDPFGTQLFRHPGQGRPVKMMAASRGLALIRSGGLLEILDPLSGPKPLASGITELCACPEQGPCAWYALSSANELIALDGEGQVLWKVPLGPGYARLKAYPGRVYCLGRDKVLACTRTGTVLRELTLKDSCVEPEVSSSGIVYSGGADWIVYAYRFDMERAADYGPAPDSRPRGAYGLGGYDRKAFFGFPGLSDSGFQENLLDDVEKSLKSGNMGDGERYGISLCSALARSKLDADAGRAQKKEGIYPGIRARACRLLGGFGSTESRAVLIQVLRQDPEPAVKAAAAQALGLIAWDGDGTSLDALEEACGRAPSDGWEEFLISASEAVKRISIYEGVPVTDRGMAALLRIADGPYATSVKREALAALYAVHDAVAKPE